jgi:hypothetical protein
MALLIASAGPPAYPAPKLGESGYPAKVDFCLGPSPPLPPMPIMYPLFTKVIVSPEAEEPIVSPGTEVEFDQTYTSLLTIIVISDLPGIYPGSADGVILNCC